jgi:hypothetical protein
MIKKGKFAEILRGIIERNPDGKLLSGLEAELVQAVFECHPKSRQKAGAGVAGFVVETRAFDGHPSIQCLLTGEDVGIDNCHVDHVHPHTFEKLATDWLAASGFNLTLVKLGPSPDGYGVELIDPEQRRSWTDFHRRHARLRILSRHANLSEARKAFNR